MVLVTKHHISRSHLLWATYHLASHGMPLSKRAIIRYLRDQIAMFGDDEQSLFGPNDWQEDDSMDMERAAYFVDTHWPDIKD